MLLPSTKEIALVSRCGNQRRKVIAVVSTKKLPDTTNVETIHLILSYARD